MLEGFKERADGMPYALYILQTPSPRHTDQVGHSLLLVLVRSYLNSLSFYFNLNFNNFNLNFNIEVFNLEFNFNVNFKLNVNFNFNVEFNFEIKFNLNPSASTTAVRFFSHTKCM